jgi:phage-related protein
MTLEELQVLITANTTELKNELKESKKELASLEREVKKKTNNIAGFFKKMIPIGVLAIGFKKLTSSSEQAYKSQIQNETRLLAVMQKRGEATKQDIQDILNLTAAEQSLGVVSDEVQLAGAQELSTYIDKAGSIKKLLPQLNNMIAQQYGYNATQEEAINIATMMGKVLEGQTGALSRYGYYFDENQEKILKFGTEEEKVATLTSIIHDSIGDVNEALGNTAVGKQIQLANAWSDVKEQLGYVIVQVKQVLVPVFQVLVTWLGTAVSYLRQFLQVLGFTASKQNGVNKAIIGGASAETEYGDAVEDSTKKQNKQLASFDEMNVLKENNSSDDSGNTGNSSGIGGLNNIDFNIGIDGDVEVSEKIQKLKDKIEEFGKSLNFTYLKEALYNLKKSFEPFADNIGNGLQWIFKEILVPISKWTIEDVIPKFLNIFSGALNVLNQAIEDVKPLFNWLWEEILKPIAEWTGGVIVDILDGIGKGLKQIAKNEVAMSILEGIAIAIGAVAAAIAIYNAAMVVCNVVTGIFSGIMAILTSPITLVVLAIGALIAVIILCVKHWDEIKKAAVNVWNKIKEIWNTVADWFNRNVIQPVANFFTNLWNGITNGVKSAINFIKNTFNSVVSFFKNIISTIVGLFKNIGTKVGDVIGGAFKAVVNGVLKAIENILNFPIKTINKLIKTINKIPGINIGTLPTFSLPRLAKGGVIDKPTLAEIGENGREVVMPLENNTGWISELAEEINERNNSIPTHITFKIGEDAVVDKFIDDIRKKGFETNGEVVFSL